MPISLQIALLAGAVIYLGIILLLLKRDKLTVRYAVAWLISGFVLILFAAFPYIVYVLRDLLHIEMPSNLVFLLLFIFVLTLLLSLTCSVSETADKLKQLTQKNALLEQRVRELEANTETTQPSDTHTQKS